MSTEPPDIRERSQTTDGRTLTLERRLFMQLLAFGESERTDFLIEALSEAELPAVLYEDVNDRTGVALLTFTENPDFFLADLRSFLRRPPFCALRAKPEYTMLGRTYAQGHEPDLEQALLTRPRQKVCDPKMPWGIWYPLRRAGAFDGSQRRSSA
jgi:hypothetical protein